MDKLSSSMPGWNGYQMSFNSPINFIDPTGLMPSTTIDGQEISKEKRQESGVRLSKLKEDAMIEIQQKEFEKIDLGATDIVNSILFGLGRFAQLNFFSS